MSPSPRPHSRDLELLVFDGSKTRRAPLDGARVIGRGAEADIEIPHRRLSRLHCRIEVGQVGIKLTDLASANGTRVGGIAVSAKLLETGTIVVLGDAVQLCVVERDAPEPTWFGENPVSAPAGVEEALENRDGVPATLFGAESTPEREELPPPRRSPAVRRLPDLPSLPTRTEPGPRALTAQGGARPQRGGSSGRVYLTLAVIAAAVVLVFFASRPSDERRAADAFLAAKALEASGREHDAALSYAVVASSWPETSAAKSARERAAALEQREEKRRGAAREFQDILLSKDPASTDEMLQSLRDVAARHAEVVSASDLEPHLAAARALGERRTQEFLKLVRKGVLLALDARDYASALTQLHEAQLSPRGRGDARAALDALALQVKSEAERAFAAALSGKDALAEPGMRQELLRLLPRFQGTEHAADLRARISIIDANLARRRSEPLPGSTPNAEREALPRQDELLPVLAKAERCAEERRYGEAVTEIDKAIALVHGAERRRIEARRDRLFRLASIIDALVARITERPHLFQEMELGGGTRGRAVAANADRVEISLGGGSRLFWPWSRMTGSRFRQLVSRAGLEGEVSVEAATFLLEMGDGPGALEILADRLKKEPGHQRRVMDLVAEAKGFSGVPEGGFRLFEDRFLTPDEYERARIASRTASLVSQIVRAAPGAWKAPLDELIGLGERAVAAARDALRERAKLLESRASGLPALQPRALATLRGDLYRELLVRREAALQLINDPIKYPYPNGDAVQPEVDLLVAKVRQVWSMPGSILLEGSPDLKALLDDAVVVADSLKGLGDENPKSPRAILDRVDGVVDMPAFAPDASSKKLLEHWKSVRAYNASLSGVITEPERECHRLTNEYRFMMGLPPVMISDELVQGARGHSEEMSKLGYFAHNSPTPGRESPGQRCRLAGWGSSVSENIARGQSTAERVLAAWCGSSGHHRNILKAGWTHLGVGHCPDTGHFWTQNFGRGSAKPPKGARPSKSRENDPKER